MRASTSQIQHCVKCSCETISGLEDDFWNCCSLMNTSYRSVLDVLDGEREEEMRSSETPASIQSPAKCPLSPSVKGRKGDGCSCDSLTD
ncbi:hypothetical protein CDAR_548901 [Caerostris darwini]|uniref:Uncharacterized protein n=1 Tax=Caerostris darwini TaxID=1538125 RepID=A0AAV4WKY3_9ARAC|nr:hypothetical protein CDAR_548901 [Caerostris darwini]